jgi:two-component system, OmpR family, manganese sensing sensor histidine kinase
VQFYKSKAEIKQITLKSQITKDLYLLGEAEALKRLFINLIENAITYTPTQGMVEIKASCVNCQIIINIQDTGIGIATEHLGKVFERFWRADKSRDYNSSGSGLGLAIAQTIATNHNGSISVTSQLAIGSCFTVNLPLHKLN